MNINCFPKKKLMVIDILRICSPDDILVIRDITPSIESLGSDGDGVVYIGKKEPLLRDKIDVISGKEIISIYGYRDDYNTGLNLTVQSSMNYKCPKCGSIFIPGDNRSLLTHMCARCGSEMENIIG